ncbi:MAG: GNAT family N-acetyltransferase [Marinifilaceae bacterium]
MIHFERINSSSDHRLGQLLDLYAGAFPEIERRDEDTLLKLIDSQSDMDFHVIYDDNDMAGLFITWNLGGFHYIEHFAVFPAMRNRKIGERVLAYYKTQTYLPVLLEAEPAEDEMASRRISFYERNGFSIVEKEYRQLPYRKGGKSFQLWIMSSESYTDPLLLQEHLYTIKERVYSRFWH